MLEIKHSSSETLSVAVRAEPGRWMTVKDIFAFADALQRSGAPVDAQVGSYASQGLLAGLAVHHTETQERPSNH